MTSAEKSQRWIWFVDVLFGAIVALGIAKYEPTVREIWRQEEYSLLVVSLFVSASVWSFVVYDIAVFHILTKRFPYNINRLGFLRFYVDLIMVSILYILMVNAFQAPPDWLDIAITVSSWHFVAIIWHVLAQYEHKKTDGLIKDAIPHFKFILSYWFVVFFLLYWE
ncbi:MAG: hypothetical protein KIT59_09860 [Nitrosomonas sp.]|nr:hypothetical protein [Nitrosomonas sp.]